MNFASNVLINGRMKKIFVHCADEDIFTLCEGCGRKSDNCKRVNIESLDYRRCHPLFCIECQMKFVDIKFELENLERLGRELERRYNNLSKFKKFKLKLKRMKYKKAIKKGLLNTLKFLTGTLDAGNCKVPYHLLLGISYLIIIGSIPGLPVLAITGGILFGSYECLKGFYYVIQQDLRDRN